MESTDINILADAIAQKLNFQPRWLKLSAASKYASIGKDRLKTLAFEKKIIGYQEPDARGDWIFDKESLDSYRLSIVAKNKQKAISILTSL
jgi:hypothetical protein